LSQLALAMRLYGGSAVSIDTPYASLDKADVVRLGDELGVPMAESWSCLRLDHESPCGACTQCLERQEAFSRAASVGPERDSHSVFSRRSRVVSVAQGRSV
jgi:7-cyano-7-deazaguanine synthase